jgi:hypothetical protein
MMKRLLLFTTLLSLVSACKKQEALLIKPMNFSEKVLSGCDTGCPEITVNYISVEEDSERSRKINAKINEFIIDALYLGDEATSPSAKDIGEAAAGFVSTYRTHSAEFPDMQLEYFAEINISETYHSEELLSLEMRHYLFTGGAHGYGATFFANFDAKTGEELEPEDLFTDIDTFTLYAEKAFRKEYEIPDNESINATGFWFENDTFYLPESVGFEAEHLVLIYNQYDIASYAAGPIELQLPISEIKNYLAFTLP